MVRSPSRAAVRAIRQAISPRLAIKTDANMPDELALLGARCPWQQTLSERRAGPVGPARREQVAPRPGPLALRVAVAAAPAQPARLGHERERVQRPAACPDGARGGGWAVPSAAARAT